ncbi:MAG: alpha-galactosidase, partial [Phycisphaerales bacterium]|nr:alpha-galactosidase [Phycisphaerales bacterium]
MFRIINSKYQIYPVVLMALFACTTLGVQNTNVARPVELPFEQVLPGTIDQYEALTLSGVYCKEYYVNSQKLDANGLRLEVTQGRSGQGAKPWLLVRHIESGQGIGIFLAYPGNWRIELKPAGDNTILHAATIPYPLETYDNVNGLPVPGALVSEFRGSWDDGANAIKAFIRSRLLRDMGNDWPLVQYNTWYDRSDRVEGKRSLELAAAAADLGCELFTLDAGWYGNESNWITCLGDWTVRRERFPEGLEPLVQRVRELGMKFGLWVEIECAHRDASIVRENPDWILPVKTGSDRVCLDFGKPEVLAWASEIIDRLVNAYKLDYIKMDFNANLLIDSEADGQNLVLWRHYRGLSRLWTDMRKKYPAMVIENCSSGSLRGDLSSAAYCDTHWVSDAIPNMQNFVMNFGAAYMFPPEFNSHWTCRPENTDHLDIQTCFRVNMLGHFGVSGALIHSEDPKARKPWSDEARQQGKKEVALYKELRPLIRKADVFHLTAQADVDNPGTGQILQYTD